MRDIALGQYYPADSIVHKMDPRSKILISLIYLISIFFINSYIIYISVFLIVIATAMIAKIPLRLMFKSIRPVMYLIIFTAIINLFFSAHYDKMVTINLYFKQWTAENIIFKYGVFGMSLSSIDKAVSMSIRLMLLVLGPTLLTLTTTPVTLTDGIESMLSPLKVVRFPVHELALIMSIALKFIPTIMEETDKITLAQKARCADFESGNIFKKAKSLMPVLIPLFVNSIRRAEELAYAMDSRCYRGSKGRTKMKKLRLSLKDYFGLLLGGIFMFVILTLKYGWLTQWFGISFVLI